MFEPKKTLMAVCAVASVMGPAAAKLPDVNALLSPDSKVAAQLPDKIQMVMKAIQKEAHPYFRELYTLDTTRSYDVFSQRIMDEITSRQFNPHFHAAAYAYLLVAQHEQADPRRSAFLVYYEYMTAYQRFSVTGQQDKIRTITANLTARFAFIDAAVDISRASCLQDKNPDAFYDDIKLPAFWEAIKEDALRLDPETKQQAATIARGMLENYKAEHWPCVDGKQKPNFSNYSGRAKAIFGQYGLRY